MMGTGCESKMAAIFLAGWDGTITLYSGTGNNWKHAIVNGKYNWKEDRKIAVVGEKYNRKPTGTRHENSTTFLSCFYAAKNHSRF